jgi:2-polyprenyl-3-methyl-5-hydroxy-6-metoxy-1,4-benzoquinol methylase
MASASTTISAANTYTEPLCALCGCASGTVQFAYDDIKIIRCDQCGLWRTCPRLQLEKLIAYYEEHHYSDSIQQSGQYEHWRETHKDVWSVNADVVLKEARQRKLGSGGTFSLLDVGSGHGFFLEQCVARGIHARGIETSQHAVDYAREKLKLDVRPMPLDELPADERYDVITLWGVLEHVPDPLQTMQQVWTHLKPGGMTWVMTPNTNALERYVKGAQYFNFLNKSHLTHFHRSTLRALLEKAGFQNVRRYLHWGGGTRSGPAAAAQYLARVLCLGTELRFIGERPVSAGGPR